MGLLDRLKNLRGRKEEEAMPVPEPLQVPSMDNPQIQSQEPEPYVEQVNTQEIIQRGSYGMQNQQASQGANSLEIQQIKSFMEVLSTKMDMLKMQLEHLNQALTVINAKLR